MNQFFDAPLLPFKPVSVSGLEAQFWNESAAQTFASLVSVSRNTAKPLVGTDIIHAENEGNLFDLSVDRATDEVSPHVCTSDEVLALLKKPIDAPSCLLSTGGQVNLLLGINHHQHYHVVFVNWFDEKWWIDCGPLQISRVWHGENRVFHRV